MADEYRAAVIRAFEEMQELLRKREYIDTEIGKKRQYIRAAIMQLPVEEQSQFDVQYEMLTKNLRGLTEAVREALRIARLVSNRQRGFVTATQVRDYVMDSGFDFSDYKSNPLASIHTVLMRRLKPEEMEKEVINGVMHFRWKGHYNLEEVRLMEAMT